MPWSSAPGWNNKGWNRTGSFILRIAGQTYTTNSAATMTVTGSSAIEAGDMLLIYSFGSGSTAVQTLTLSGTGALTPVDTQAPADGFKYRTYIQELAAGDISSGNVGIAVSGTLLSNTYLSVAVIRNADWVAFKEFSVADNTSPTLGWTGFTPAANTRGSIILGIDRQNTAPSPSTNPAVSGGGSWTKQTLTGGGELPGPALRMFQWDNLAYSGGAISSTGWPTSGTAGAGYNSGAVFELLGP